MKADKKTKEITEGQRVMLLRRSPYTFAPCTGTIKKIRIRLTNLAGEWPLYDFLPDKETCNYKYIKDKTWLVWREEFRILSTKKTKRSDK